MHSRSASHGHVKKNFLYTQASKLSHAVFEWCLPQWKAHYGEDHILYIDESGVNTTETEEYGWSPKGHRLGMARDSA